MQKFTFFTYTYRLAALFSALILASCQTPLPTIPAGDSAYLAMDSSNANSLPYTLGPRDRIAIRVFGEKDLSFDDISLDLSGNIDFPLIGTIVARGMTPSELSKFIQNRLGVRYLVNPNVSVSLTEARSNIFTVDGEVKKPGVYELPNDATLIDAIALAQGVTNVAHLNEIIIIREGPDGTYAAMFDLNKIRKIEAPIPHILRNDVVIVGRSTAAARYQDFLMFAPVLTASFIRVLFN